jgi:hypothetical protein
MHLGTQHQVLWAGQRAGLVSQKRLVVEPSWSQLTSECQRFGHPPPRLNNQPWWTQPLEDLTIADHLSRGGYATHAIGKVGGTTRFPAACPDESADDSASAAHP